jgi:hypothetical protein
MAYAFVFEMDADFSHNPEDLAFAFMKLVKTAGIWPLAPVMLQA